MGEGDHRHLLTEEELKALLEEEGNHEEPGEGGLLTQEELDVLLGALDRIPEVQPPVPEDIKPYDLTNPDLGVQGFIFTLEMISERFARFFHASLFSILRGYAEIELKDLKIQSFGSYAHQLPAPVSVNVLNVRPFGSAMLLVFHPRLVSRAVEVFFGGGGLSLKPAIRDFTSSEMRMIRKLVHAALDDLQEAWRSIYPLGFECTDTEINPHYVGVISNHEVVVSAIFKVDVEGLGSEMHLCMPYSMLEPLRHDLAAPVQSREGAQDEHFRRAMQEALLESQLEASGLLTEITLTLQELMELSQGDVLPVDIPQAIPLVVEGVPLYEGAYGIVRGKWALKIQRALMEEDR
ncbi:MAG: flagellar motor switch protein FliM [Gammaproteobacteria bacterium]|nr:MAG: flagellar motor switch protein FliM [Gammaproteobacteria bacterium]